MKHIIFFLLFPVFAYSQGGTWPVKYNDSDPSGAPSASGTRLHFNTATNTLWFWEPAPSSTWRKQPKAFDQITGCAAPAYTPTARQSTFAVNSCTPPELYQYTGSAWECLNCVDGLNLTAGAGITLMGTSPDITISAADASPTNELNTSLSVTGGNLRLTDPGGNLDVPVSSIAPVQAVSAGPGISISGTTTRTITNTAPDQSVTISAGTGIGVSGTYPNFTVTNSAPNVVQTLSIAGQDLTLSGGGGTVAIPGGDKIYTADGTITGNRVVGLVEKTLEISGSYDNRGDIVSNSLSIGAGQIIFNVADPNAKSDFFAGPGNLSFLITDQLTSTATSLEVQNGVIRFASGVSGWHGAEYTSDYSATIVTNPTSITDVTSVNLLKQTPVSYTNAAAPNNTIFYSTTDGKLSYKDPGGTVHNLY